MDYAAMRALHMPIGSGAIESAVRRVINLRLKSPAYFGMRTRLRKYCYYVLITRPVDGNR